MTASWVAGTVRAQALSRRRVGAAGARALAARPTLEEAVTALEHTSYAHDLPARPTLEGLQHGVTASVLWHLRVLAGWLPREGAEMVRDLASGFEIGNVDEHLAAMPGPAAVPPYALGSLETAWSRLAPTTTPEEVRDVLAASAWGDPGSAGTRAIGLAMRLTWADRVAARVPDAATWARAAAALLVVQETRVRGRPLDETAGRRAASVLGPRFVAALDAGEDLGQLSELLGADGAWAVSDVEVIEDLWRAQAAWYRRVERDGLALLRGSGFGVKAVVGAVAVLAVDAWRVRAALEVADRGGAGPALEVFDAVA